MQLSTISKILLTVLLSIPTLSFAAPNFSTPYYNSFEDETVGADLLATPSCEGFWRGTDITADCDAYYDDEYPARYGDKYLQMTCQYDGDRDHRGRAMRSGNHPFGGFRDTAADGGYCHNMYTNDGTEYWIAWSNYIPPEYPSSKMMHSVMQIGTDNLGQVTSSLQYGAFEKYQPRISASNKADTVSASAALAPLWQPYKGTWIDFVFHVVWYDTSHTDARFEYYINGVRQFERNGSKNIGTGGHPTLVFNDYNWAFAQNLEAEVYIEDPDSPIKREVPMDEFRFHQQRGGAGDSAYCDVAPPIWAAPPEITYPVNEQNNMPISFTALFDGYEDHRSDPQNCFSYEETQVQIDEDGGNWSTLVFDNTSSSSETQMAVSGLSGGTTYQMRVRHNSQRVDSTDEYESAEWEVVQFTTTDATDTTPPVWTTTVGITDAIDQQVGGTVYSVYGQATDNSGGYVTRWTYWATASEWDQDDWSNNSRITYGAVYDLIDGTEYTFGVRACDESGNCDTNTNTVNETPTDGTTNEGITGVSGSFVDGNTVVISGSGFGSSGPTVVLFDDFEGGTLGENIETGTDSAKVGDWNARSGSSYYGGASLSGDKSFSSTYANGYTNYIEVLLLANTRNVYLSWWLFLPAGNNYPGEGSVDGINWKQMWIQGSSTTDDDLVVPTRTTTWLIDGNDADPGYVNYTTVDMSKGEWKRLSVWLKGSTSSSSNDGEVKFWELTDTGTVTRENDVGVNTLKATGTWDRVRPNGYGRQTDTCIVSFDDIYIASGANAQARVEIGNASTYLGSTELTILTPTDWDDTEISATVNAGTFEQFDNGYLYVTDADGNTSDGFPVTFESTQTSTTITGSGTNATTGPGTPAVVGVIGGAILLTMDGDAMIIDNDIITVEGLVQ